MPRFRPLFWGLVADADPPQFEVLFPDFEAGHLVARVMLRDPNATNGDPDRAACRQFDRMTPFELDVARATAIRVHRGAESG